MSSALAPHDRRLGLGASEVAAAIGLSPWRSPIDVWLEKTGRTAQGPETDAMRWGSALEPIILDWYERETGRSVGFRQERRQVGDSPVWATLDGIALNMDGDGDKFCEWQRVVEAKSASWSRGWGDPGTDRVPVYYLVQVQIQTLAASLPVADIPATIAGRPPVIYTVSADRGLQDALMEKALDFWRLVESDTPPEADSGAELRKLLDVLHPADTQAMRMATSEEAQIARDLRAQQRIAKEADALVEWTSGRLKRLIGDAAGIEGDFGRVTWKATKTSSRVFRATWADEGAEE